MKGEIRAGLVKIADCCQRINDQLTDDDQAIKDPGYVAKQLHFVANALDGIERSLRAHYQTSALEKPKESTEG